MLATLSIQNRVRDRLRELGISASTFAGLVGLSDNTVSDFLRGKRNLGCHRETKMLELLDDLIAYKESMRPFELPWSDVSIMRRLIEHLRKNEISPEQVREYITALVGSE